MWANQTIYEMAANTRKRGDRLGIKTSTYLLVKPEDWRCRTLKKFHWTENFFARVGVPRRKLSPQTLISAPINAMILVVPDVFLVSPRYLHACMLTVGHKRIQTISNYCGCIPHCLFMTYIIPSILYIHHFRECVCRRSPCLGRKHGLDPMVLARTNGPSLLLSRLLCLSRKPMSCHKEASCRPWSKHVMCIVISHQIWWILTFAIVMRFPMRRWPSQQYVFLIQLWL